MSAVGDLIAGLAGGDVELIDLTVPLTERTPVINLPPPFANTRGLSLEEVSRYDDRGPGWYWNNITIGEHAGTHFDAPAHWVTGRDKATVDRVPPRHLVAAAAVVDIADECAGDPDHLLEVADLKRWQEEHGPLPEGGWLLLHTGWDRRADDPAAFLNTDDSGSHTPGPSAACARWIAEESPVIGLGVETVGTDAGLAGTFDPPFPCHTFMHGAGKYGLTSLVGLDRLPPTGIMLVVAPLPIVGGSGSPARAYALAPRGSR
ncbi:MAG TPA: cyclase family protein [Candidatus Dormibacteraeota bacterium]|jgi:kynurenine formamidase|nr:cyclase family protein [Candidatus Dormibacteraeota bacterium]